MGGQEETRQKLGWESRDNKVWFEQVLACRTGWPRQESGASSPTQLQFNVTVSLSTYFVPLLCEIHI